MEAPVNKPGVKTSEFYLTIVSSIVGILVTLGYLTPQQGDDLVKAVVAIIGGVLTISSVLLYLYGRFKLKQLTANNSTTQPVLPIKDKIEGLANDPNLNVYPGPSTK